MTRITKTEVCIRIFASCVLQAHSYVYPCDDSDESVGVLHSVVCGYPQACRHQDVLQKVGVAFCMLMHMLCGTAFPHKVIVQG